MRTTTAILFCSLAIFTTRVEAQDSVAKQAPAAVMVAIRDLESLQSSFKHLLKTASYESVAPMMDSYIAMLPEGLDKSRPIVCIGDFDPDQDVLQATSMKVCVALPVNNAEAIVGALALIGLPAPEKVDGIWTAITPISTFYAREQTGWLMVSTDLDYLKKTKIDPARSHQKMLGRYDIGFSLQPELISTEAREQALMQLQQKNDIELANMDQSTIEFMFAKMFGEFSMSVFRDADQVLAGIKLDPAKQETTLELGVQLNEKSTLLDDLRSVSELRSAFRKIHFPNESDRVSCQTIIPVEYRERLVSILRKTLDDALLNAEHPADDVEKEAHKMSVALMESMVRSGTIDVVTSTDFREKGQGIYCVRIADPSSIPNLLRVVQRALAKKDKNLTIELDHASHKGLTIHRLAFPLPEIETPDDAAQFLKRQFGDAKEFTMAIGIMKDLVVIVATKDPVADLKKCLDQASDAATGEPGFYSVQTTMESWGTWWMSMTTLIGGTSDLQTVPSQLNDRIVIHGRTTERGVVLKLQIGDGSIDWLAKNLETIQANTANINPQLLLAPPQ